MYRPAGSAELTTVPINKQLVAVWEEHYMLTEPKTLVAIVNSDGHDFGSSPSWASSHIVSYGYSYNASGEKVPVIRKGDEKYFEQNHELDADRADVCVWNKVIEFNGSKYGFWQQMKDSNNIGYLVDIRYDEDAEEFMGVGTYIGIDYVLYSIELKDIAFVREGDDITGKTLYFNTNENPYYKEVSFNNGIASSAGGRTLAKFTRSDGSYYWLHYAYGGTGTVAHLILAFNDQPAGNSLCTVTGIDDLDRSNDIVDWGDTTILPANDLVTVDILCDQFAELLYIK